MTVTLAGFSDILRQMRFLSMQNGRFWWMNPRAKHAITSDLPKKRLFNIHQVATLTSNSAF